jgi:hypothetical protein
VEHIKNAQSVQAHLQKFELGVQSKANLDWHKVKGLQEIASANNSVRIIQQQCNNSVSTVYQQCISSVEQTVP